MPEKTGDGAHIEVLAIEDALGISGGHDLLVVDDDAGNLVAYEAALAPLGRPIVAVSSGTDALAKLLDQDVALILLDVSMPGMNGLETARTIRARPRNRSTPIIFITGEASTTDLVLEAYGAGGFDFLTKPIVPELLRAKVRVHLQLQERTQRLIEQSIELRETRGRLAETQRALRETAAVASRRLEKLQEATSGLASARTPAEVAALAVRLGAEAVAAAGAVMWLVEDDGSLSLAGSHQIPIEYLEHWRRISTEHPAPALRVVREQRELWVENEADYAREAPDVIDRARAADRVFAFAALPVVDKQRVIGVVTFSYAGDHVFSEEERRFLRALVHACEHALERARLYAAEAEARRAAEAESARKDEFLAMLGHELRNPLAAMLSAVELIKLREGTGRRDVAVLDRQLAHLVHVVGDLLDVGRITRGKITLHRVAVDLAAAVVVALDVAQPTIERRRHHVSVDIPPGVFVDADRERLGQTLANLLLNAATYTSDAGRIEISAERADDHARIVVRDNGRGIPAELLPKVFEPFVQGERGLDRREGGLGIGLTLVRTIVELHGGRVEAHSEGAGTGATFTIWWPLATTTDDSQPSRRAKRPRKA